jgi:hypothetical protein
VNFQKKPAGLDEKGFDFGDFVFAAGAERGFGTFAARIILIVIGSAGWRTSLGGLGWNAGGGGGAK